MIATNITQFTNECSKWKETLRFYRTELTSMQMMLQKAMQRSLSREEQSVLERLQNQLYVQLINVHDLKHAVKNHFSKLHLKISGKADVQFSENVYAYHENLSSNYTLLENRLSELSKDLFRFGNVFI